MLVVVDTNVMLSAFARHSPTARLFRALAGGEVRLAVEIVQPSFQFRVISVDPDDNTFVDCAIVAGADFVITRDTDYAALANAGYKPQPILPEDFIARYLSP
jgi:predicted nucleic acid-binding protein